jgi:hypothetical protein
MKLKGLWRNPDFLKLWSGQTISLFGSQITFLAIPITATLLLQATPAQMGLLGAAEMAPALALGLFAGVWIDRLQRRPVIIAVDILRATLLLVIPLGWRLGFLNMSLLYLLGFLLGCLTFLFDVSYRSYLPSLVQRSDLIEANSKLEVTNSLSYIAGPGLAGWLVEWLSAPIAILADAATFLLSALSLGLIRQPEPLPEAERETGSLQQRIGAGLRLILNRPLLRAMAISALTSNFAGGFYSALLVIYITRQLGLSALFFGMMYGVGSFSGLLAAIGIRRLQSRFGVGWSFITGDLMIGIGWFSIPLLSWYFNDPRLVILGGMLVAGFGNTTCNITSTSLAQAIIPPNLLGRYNASLQFIELGGLPIGSLLGGALGTLIGVRGGLMVGGAIMLTAFLWPLFSPLRGLQSMPVLEPEADP